jgi:hypothetical protein
MNYSKIQSEWHGMTPSQAYRLARKERVEMLRDQLQPLQGTERQQRFKGMAGRLSHSETVVADIEFNVFGDR